MATLIPRTFRTHRLARVLWLGGSAAVICLLLLASLVAALPMLLSTSSVQAILRQQLSKSFQRQVDWADLTLSWSGGLALKGLKLGTGPAPLLSGNVGEAIAVPRFSYVNGRVRLDLLLRIRTVAAELAPGPPAPPKPYQEPLTTIAKALQKFESLDRPLPLDLGVTVTIEPMRLQYRDPRTGRELTMDKGTVRLDLPSLADRPVTAGFRGNLTVDGKRLEALNLALELKQLVSPERRIRPARAYVSATAKLPGAMLTIDGGLKEPGGMHALLRLDLPRLTAAAGPLLAPAMPAMLGSVAIDLHARSDTTHDLHATLELTGSRIALHGGATW
ncbi:hypothetical protein OR1_02117 [Geobacter sp. OR-1]|uniref:hypothetical protein n=1 Tax=Geobacter sp. OR-1 TaxID=1266765 RepID=UPI000542F276|nr:hypothetical protein [Geobacter sp. OR-1]GAM09835.1 hypothetical protein OR1_02117 [Geobacter sp. OR-1]